MDDTPRPIRRCVRCGDELGEGVRFCVACGTTNGDPYAAATATADLNVQAHKRRTFIENFTYWYRFWVSGLRR